VAKLSEEIARMIRQMAEECDWRMRNDVHPPQHESTDLHPYDRVHAPRLASRRDRGKKDDQQW
jgi:hypothetical protein